MRKMVENGTFWFLGLIFLAGCAGVKEQADKETPPPNIIFVMADDLGYGDLGVYGQDKIKTPAIDRLAYNGMKFSEVYAGAPVCAPSRSVLMTGQHTGHTKVRGNFAAEPIPGLPKPRRVPLGPTDTTVAEVLKKAGYVTGMFGKWGLGEATTTGEPNEKGFDEWFGYNNQRRAHSHYPEFVWHNRDTFFIEANIEGQKGQHVHELFTQFALDFLDKNRDTTFFMYLPYTLPHSDFDATEPFMDLYADKDWTEQEKTYAAMVSMVDADMDTIMSQLDKYGIAENTLIFFCSDNGAANRYEGTFNSSGPLRGRKRDMFEGGLRTPMIASLPGVIPAGVSNDQPWYFADLLPTLAHIADVQAPTNIDGENIWPALLGRDMPELEDRYFYWEFHERGFDQAVRWKEWKGIRHGLDSALELYNLNEDIDESENLAGSHPEITSQLTHFLDSARTRSKYWPIQN